MQWQNHPSEAGLEIIRFLVEAGADSLLFAEFVEQCILVFLPEGLIQGFCSSETSSSAHDILTLGLFQHLLYDPSSDRPHKILKTILQTNSAAIDVFRSVLNMDAMDALEDLLTRHFGHSDEDVSHLWTSLESTEYSVARYSVFNAIDYTPLQYAIKFSPSSVKSLLLDGADAAAEPLLAYAASAARAELIELLLGKGADVNMKDRMGRTALHWACYICRYNPFFELVRCAEGQIDWNARTLEGQTALDLFELCVSEGRVSHWASVYVDQVRATFMSHMDPSQAPECEDDAEEPLHMPGAFPAVS